MRKFYGPIGFAETVETKPGVWTNSIVEHNYYIDVDKFNIKHTTNSDSTNDDLDVNSQFSFIADPFAVNHFTSMKYIEFMGTRWKILSVLPRDHRLVLTVGGVFNG